MNTSDRICNNDHPWELVEYECEDGECLMIHNIPKDMKIGALSLDHRSVGEAIVDELNEQAEKIRRKDSSIHLITHECRRMCQAQEGQIKYLKNRVNEQKDLIDGCIMLAQHNDEQTEKYIHSLIGELNDQSSFKLQVIRVLNKHYEDALIYRTPIKKIRPGEDIGYWNGVKQEIEKIFKELGIDCCE